MAEYWVIDGHLEDCPYLRALRWNEEDGVVCDCRERQEDDDSYWDEEDDLVD